MCNILGIDHVAITVVDLAASTAFYDELVGTETVAEYVVDGKTLVRQLAMGGAVLSIHQEGNGFDLVARRPTVGAGDICLRSGGPMSGLLDLLKRKNIDVIEGPTPRRTADRQSSH